MQKKSNIFDDWSWSQSCISKSVFALASKAALISSSSEIYYRRSYKNHFVIIIFCCLISGIIQQKYMTFLMRWSRTKEMKLMGGTEGWEKYSVLSHGSFIHHSDRHQIFKLWNRYKSKPNFRDHFRKYSKRTTKRKYGGRQLFIDFHKYFVKSSLM